MLVLAYIGIGIVLGVLSLILGSVWPRFGDTVTDVYGGEYSEGTYYELYGLSRREGSRFLFFILLVLFWPIFLAFIGPGWLLVLLISWSADFVIYLSTVIDKNLRRY